MCRRGEHEAAGPIEDLYRSGPRELYAKVANGRVVKHADDTVLLALLSSSEYDDSHALLEFSACRDGAGLQGNISKTKEMAI
ncbi:hypothetical protein ROHU_028723 [Labeo rohita]|uniref:Uncharacterized protein n=1 Tax=Labeo rohita TaxID=84645 RepID=A0A498M5I4_LABRO|nr:hypothetical protein ROHU_028723 [Labeo rohita]